MKALPGLGVDVRFVQDGVRNNDGYYQLSDWGPLQQPWITEHLPLICAALDKS